MCVAALNSKKNTKTPYFGVQSRSRSSMLVSPKRSSAVIAMISSKSASICNRSRARLVDSSRNRTFWREYIEIWCHRTEDSLNIRGRNLYCQNLRLMLKNLYAGCLGLFLVISAQFTLEMCVAAQKREKYTKIPYFGGSGSFKVINGSTTGKIVSSACYDKQQVYLQPPHIFTYIRAYSGLNPIISTCFSGKTM